MMHTIKKIIKMIIPFGIIAYYQSLKEKKEYQLKASKTRPLSTNSKNKCRYIITLTSYGKRVKSTAPYTICSLLNQTMPPDRIILWLAHGTEAPPILQDLTKKGVEIKFCEDIGSYTKLIPALKEFPEDVLITADDDKYYPENWFEQLKTAYTTDNKKIYAHRIHKITFDERNNIMPYEKWQHVVTGSSGALFPTGVGGILYPPNSLDKRCCETEEFLNLAPKGDDIWFWAMAQLKGTEYGLVNTGCTYFADVAPFNDGLYAKNKWENDRQIKNVLNRFPELLEHISPAKD